VEGSRFASLAPRRGRVELAGRLLTSTGAPVRAVPPWQRRVGLLRQDPGIFPHLSVRANLTYARSARPGRGARAERPARAERAERPARSTRHRV